VTFRLDFDNRESQCGSADSRGRSSADGGVAMADGAAAERYLPVVTGLTFFTVSGTEAAQTPPSVRFVVDLL